MVDLKDDHTPVNEGEIEQQKTEQGGESKLTNSEKSTEVKDFTEKPIKLEDLEEEKEYSSEEYDELCKLYEDTISDYVEGELVVGKILAIGSKDITVDIGFKSEGTIPIEEFSNPEDLKVGNDIEVYIDNIEDTDGLLVLSKKKVDFIHSWEKVVSSYETGEILQGKCTRRIKGGIVVDLNGVDAFLPGSQIDVKPIRDFDAFIGNTMDFKVVKVNNLRKNIVVSHRVLVEEEMKEQREKILENLEKNQILEGTVKNITDFGVFIDLGGVDGLLHINDLSWGRVSHPSEIVALDESIKVMVLDYNDEKNRISLGLKQLQPHPWENVKEKYPVDTVVKGKVVNISDYGAFVELEKGVEGLIHISEMSWTQHIKHPSKLLAVGEIVEAKILSIDQEDKKISLGLKQLEPDPWDTLEEKYPINSRHQGKVRNLTNFGAFVELEEGIDGLIHISDLSWTKKIRHPGEVVKKGDEIEVVVLNVDRANRRISLGYKQIAENPWDTFEETYKPGTVIHGKIVRLIEKGVIAELPDGVDGFVPMSHLAKPNITKPSDGYKVGDDLELCVIEFNKSLKKIVLSEKIDYAQSLIEGKDIKDKNAVVEEDGLFGEKEAKPDQDSKTPSEKEKVEESKESAKASEEAVEEEKKTDAEPAEKSEEKAEATEPESADKETAPEVKEEDAKPEPVAEEKDAEAQAEEAPETEAKKEEAEPEKDEPKAEAAKEKDEPEAPEEEKPAAKEAEEKPKKKTTSKKSTKKKDEESESDKDDEKSDEDDKSE